MLDDDKDQKMYSIVNLTEDYYSNSFFLISANRLLKKIEVKRRRVSSVYKIMGREFEV